MQIFSSSIGKIDEYKNNVEKSSKTKVSGYIPSGFSMSTITSLNDKGNKHDVYRGKDCKKNFCESFREHAVETINFKKKCSY